MKGIMFQSHMRQAIIDLRKTQTRRIESSLREINEHPDLWTLGVQDVKDYWRFEWLGEHAKSDKLIKSRYLANETAYIKEAWATESRYNGLPPSKIPQTAHIHYMDNGVGEWPLHLTVGKLRSSMFLRECHARDFITFSRVIPQRLWDITEEDALAEGIVIMPGTHQPFEKGIDGKFHLIGKPEPYTAVYHYSALWDEINEHRGHPWSKNEWVFSYTFKLVPRPETY